MGSSGARMSGRSVSNSCWYFKININYIYYFIIKKVTSVMLFSSRKDVAIHIFAPQNNDVILWPG